MKQRCKELPEELWGSILNRLADDDDDDHCDLQSPSLVCKQFLSTTNRFRQKLAANGNVFYSNRCETLCRALERFGSLKEIELSHLGAESDVDCPLLRIASSGTPLEKLILRDGYKSNLSAHAVLILLCACPTLKHFKLDCFNFLNDDSIRYLYRYLPNLVSIELVGPSKLTPATFFFLAKECPSLLKITVEIGTLKKVQDEIVANLEKNYRIRFLDLSHNWLLKDELLKQMVFACPNLHTLDVGGCGELTKECLEEILKSCPEIKHLKVVQKTGILRKTFETQHIKIKRGIY